MTAIERCDFPHAQALRGCDDGGVDRAEREIAVGRNEFGDSEPVRGSDGLWDEIPCGKVTDEAHLGIGSDARAQQVRHLGDDEFRDDEWAGMRLKELEALLVVGVV